MSSKALSRLLVKDYFNSGTLSGDELVVKDIIMRRIVALEPFNQQIQADVYRIRLNRLDKGYCASLKQQI